MPWRWSNVEEELQKNCTANVSEVLLQCFFPVRGVV